MLKTSYTKIYSNWNSTVRKESRCTFITVTCVKLLYTVVVFFNEISLYFFMRISSSPPPRCFKISFFIFVNAFGELFAAGREFILTIRAGDPQKWMSISKYPRFCWVHYKLPHYTFSNVNDVAKFPVKLYSPDRFSVTRPLWRLLLQGGGRRE